MLHQPNTLYNYHTWCETRVTRLVSLWNEYFRRRGNPPATIRGRKSSRAKAHCVGRSVYCSRYRRLNTQHQSSRGLSGCSWPTAAARMASVPSCHGVQWREKGWNQPWRRGQGSHTGLWCGGLLARPASKVEGVFSGCDSHTALLRGEGANPPTALIWAGGCQIDAVVATAAQGAEGSIER